MKETSQKRQRSRQDRVRVRGTQGAFNEAAPQIFAQAVRNDQAEAEVVGASAMADESMR